MKKRLSKKTLFPLLFLLTTLLISLRVFAGDSHDGWKEVKTREDLSNYYVSAEKAWRVLPGEYYLTADISAASRFVVSEGDVTICLNGHMIIRLLSERVSILRSKHVGMVQDCWRIRKVQHLPPLYMWRQTAV